LHKDTIYKGAVLTGQKVI